MIEDYLQKLETIISPQTYDLNNYKDKILQSNISFPDKEFVQGLDRINSNDRQKERQADFQSQESYQKIKQEMQSNNEGLKSQVSGGKSMLEKTTIEGLDAKARGKVHNLNVKNMAYRQQIDALNRKIEEQNKLIDAQRRTIEENQVSIENTSKYLLKLESYLMEAGKNKARERFTLNLLGVSCAFAEECKDQNNKASFSVERNETREMIVSLVNENQRLKAFQTKVVEISRNFDDINESMVVSLKKIAEKVDDFTSGKPSLDSNEQFYLKEFNDNLNRILFCVEETISTKQTEYNLLIECKDKECAFLRKEIVILNESLENAKKDRMKDQKTMIEIECQNNHLHKEIDDLHKTIHENYTKLKLLDTENISSKIEKRIEPCKNTTKNILTKLEQCFDLKDKNNVKFISAINQNLHSKK